VAKELESHFGRHSPVHGKLLILRFSGSKSAQFGAVWNASFSFYPIPMQFTRWFRIVILAAAAAAHVAVCRAADTVSEQDAARLQLVQKYADTVLKDAADRYHSQDPSPLLAGGIDVYSKEHLQWVFPGDGGFSEWPVGSMVGLRGSAELHAHSGGADESDERSEIQGCRQSAIRV
jgi:hypothetical protein